MSFYAALIDLLGRCAPEMHVRHRRLGRAGERWSIPGQPQASTGKHWAMSTELSHRSGNAGDAMEIKTVTSPHLVELPVQ
jgi:hypothetical protein